MTTFTYNGHSYLLSNAGTWQDAQAEAVSMGGNLVTINDQAEQDWLTSTFANNGLLWTGYTDQETEGVWKWISGENSTYTNWSSGEPNNLSTYGENYAGFGWYSYWNDISTSDYSNIPGIIEIPNPKITLSSNTNPIEGSANGIFNITLDRPTPVGGLTINFNTAGSTATFGTDYNLLAGTNVSNVTSNSFKIAAGATSATLKLAVLTDIVSDPNETVSINLILGIGYSLKNSNIMFTNKLDYPTGSNPFLVNIGDFNGDGKTDLALACRNTISILLRNTTNTGFDTKSDNYISPASVGIGDFNGDGKDDLAIVNISSGTVSVLLRNTTNTGFDTKVDYKTAISPVSIGVGDFNGDGKTDLAVATNKYTISVLLRNNQNTGFDNKVDYYGVGARSQSIGVGDFNGDGKDDLAVVDWSGDKVSVLMSNAINTDFDYKVDYVTNSQPTSVTVGDFNGDGKADLAVANDDDNMTVSVFLRNSDNTGFDNKVDYVTGLWNESISVCDFNKDGKDDLVVAGLGGADFSDGMVLLLLRNTTNTSFYTKVDITTGSYAKSVSVADFNSDGKDDLAVANYNSGSVSVFFNTSTASAALTIADVAPVLNHPPTGTVIINDTTPQKNQVLTVSNTLADADNYGVITNTGNPLDIAINGQGFFQIRMPNGDIDYTRAGSFKIDSLGQLATSSGLLLEPTITLPTNVTSIKIGSDGIVSAQSNQTPVLLGQIQLANFTNPEGLKLLAENLYSESVSSGYPIIGTPGENEYGVVLQGSLQSDKEPIISYEWLANGLTIGTGNSHTVTANDVGKSIKVIASYTDGLGNAESVSSAATSAVTQPTANPAFVVTKNDVFTGEDGDTAMISVSLATAPIRDVVITFSSSDITEGKITNPTLTFTSSNWSTPKNITVVGQNDYLNDGNRPYIISSSVISNDVNYRQLIIDPIDITNKEDVTTSDDARIPIGTSRDVPIKLYGDIQIDSSFQPISSFPANDVLNGLDGNDTLYGGNLQDDLSGGIGNDLLYGGNDQDFLYGQEGNDTLYGEQDSDYLDGGTGNDTLDGGLGLDTLIGGAGNDTYYLGYDATDVIDDQGLSTDIDMVIMPYQLTKYTLPTGIEKGAIAEGTQASSLTGNGSNNTLTGNDGSNTLSGAIGRDSLFGGLGNDVLNGGAGNDALTGGNGKDVFVLNTALTLNTDKIADFKPVDDTIKLENQIFTQLTATGTLDSSLFIKGTAAHDFNDYVIYNPTTGAVTYDSDGSGVGQGI